MIRLIIFIMVFMTVNLAAQEFIFDIYFEDSDGNRDTLTMGHLEDFTYSNTIEQDISDTPLSDFDVRFIDYAPSDPNLPSFLFGDCDHQDEDSLSLADEYLISFIRFESKELFDGLIFCNMNSASGTRSEFIVPKDAAYPITLSWDSSHIAESCAATSFITEIPLQGTSGITWCMEQINHPRFFFRDASSLVLEEPNFLSYLREDSTLVTSYYIFFSATSLDSGVLINTDAVLEADVQIYPNPVQDKLYLETTESNWRYQILNLQGQQVLQGVYQDNISLSQLPSGIYFLQLQREGELYKAIKFVKE